MKYLVLTRLHRDLMVIASLQESCFLTFKNITICKHSNIVRNHGNAPGGRVTSYSSAMTASLLFFYSSTSRALFELQQSLGFITILLLTVRSETSAITGTLIKNKECASRGDS